MSHVKYRQSLSILSLVILGACGGGVDGTLNADAGSGAKTAAAQTPANDSSTSTSSVIATSTTTSSSAATATTSTSSSSTSTTSTSTSSTSSTTYATSTTTGSTTTTTASQNLPPLTTMPIVLDGGPNGTLGVRAWSDGNTASGGKGAPAGNANCIPYDAMVVNYFVHAHVSIFRDGQRLAIPQYIGMASACLYEINSDNMSGVVDAYSSAYKRLTLGDMFAVWGQPLSWNDIAGFSGQPVVIYIEDNGVLHQHVGDPGDIELLSRRSITIQIGAPLNEIPVYNWDKYSGG